MAWTTPARVAVAFFGVLLLVALAALKIDFAAVTATVLVVIGIALLLLRRRRPIALKAVALSVIGVLAVGVVAAAAPAQQAFTKRMLTGLLRATAGQGAGFTLEQTIAVTGGELPAGQTASLNVRARGRLLGEAADMAYDITTGQRGSFEVLVTAADFYLRPRDGAGWVVTSRGPAMFLLAGLSLKQLEREIDGAEPSGPVIPWAVGENVAGDNRLLVGDHVLEYRLSSKLIGELESIALPTGASGRLLLIVSPIGNRLDGINMHLLAEDPDAQQQVAIDSMAVFTPGRGDAISAPGDAKRVEVGDIFG